MNDRGEEVVIGGPEASIEFGRPDRTADGSGSRIPLRILAHGIAVDTVVDIESWSGGVQSLVDYFADLSREWRGWSGSKEWSDDGPSVSMAATHDGVGHVTLAVTAESASGWHGEGSWTVTIRVPVEPGALTATASKLDALVDSHRARSGEDT